MGGDAPRHPPEHRPTVSIRAPAWGATTRRRRTASGERVSIRAPAWGATWSGGDHVEQQNRSFNPRPRMGGDMRHFILVHHPGRFQSAPPHGGRLGQVRSYAQFKAVSIRAPAWGATRSVCAGSHHRSVSIRAPAWGATRRCRWRSQHGPVSIRAPAWGATSDPSRQAHPEGVSIRAPAWGATCRIAGLGQGKRVSIRAPAWGATGPCGRCSSSICGFNPRPRMGGDSWHRTA